MLNLKIQARDSMNYQDFQQHGVTKDSCHEVGITPRQLALATQCTCDDYMHMCSVCQAGERIAMQAKKYDDFALWHDERYRAFEWKSASVRDTRDNPRITAAGTKAHKQALRVIAPQFKEARRLLDLAKKVAARDFEDDDRAEDARMMHAYGRNYRQ